MNSLLNIQNLTLHAGNKTICTNLDFQVKPGEHWAILGQNGCGKTTLLNCIAGLHQPDDGTLSLNSKSIQRYSVEQRARLIGYLFQQIPADFPQTVLEFCVNSLHPHLSRLDSLNENHLNTIFNLLAKVDLQNFANRKIGSLSGGELRRVEIAALLLQSPKLWLLDEPTNHLDIRHQHSVLQLLKDEIGAQQGASLMVLHDANLANRYCSHVLMMFNDGTTLHGKRKKILNKDNLSRLHEVNIKELNQDGDRLFVIEN